MNTKEKEIMQFLRKGKKVNISKIARALDLPISTVSDRIKRIEEKYITKRSSLLDYQKLGYSSNHLLAIKIGNEYKNNFLNFIRQEKCVNSIFCTNSDFDFLIEIICKDSFEFINWVETVQSNFPVELTTYEILKTEEKEKFVPE